MPERLALLGASEGPWLDISRVKRPAIKITGLAPGSVVGIIRNDQPAMCEGVGPAFRENGEFSIETGTWIKVICLKPNKRVICMIVSQRVA